MSDILDFWCDAYRSGYRITHDGTGFVYESVDWLRISRTHTFGLFDVRPVEPPAELVQACATYAHLLRPLLCQPVPASLERWWYHGLSMQYEGVPLLQMAAKLGVAVWLLPCRLGCFPMVVKMPVEKTNTKMPTIAPILAMNGYKFNQEMYNL